VEPAAGKRVKGSYGEPLEIADVPGYDNQIVYGGRCGDHRVLDQVVRPSVTEASLGTECAGIHRQYIVRIGDLIDTGFDLGGLPRILLACHLDARLNFADRDR
jgi:hypothetical protein